MQKELKDLQPVLEETAIEVEAMMVQIEGDKAAAAVTKAQVQEQEAAANEKAAAAKAIADDAQVRGPSTIFLAACCFTCSSIREEFMPLLDLGFARLAHLIDGQVCDLYLEMV